MKAVHRKPRIPLTLVQPGVKVLLRELGDEIDGLQREQLNSYGITRDRHILVLHQQPMTIVLAEDMEIALEHSIARFIWVE